MSYTLFVAIVAAPLMGQPPPADEPRFVVRISRAFLADLTEREFSRERPIRDRILGTDVAGTAVTTGKASMRLEENEKIDGFHLLIQGQVNSRSQSVRNRITAHTQGAAQFEARRQVDFQGDKFVGRPVEVVVDYDSQLQGISSPRNGPLARLARQIAYPRVVQSMPAAQSIAEGKLRAGIEAQMIEESDAMIQTLNRVTDVASKLALLAKEQTSSDAELRIQVSASGRHLLLSVAAKDRPFMEVPELGEAEQAPVEVWIRRLDEEREVAALPAVRGYWAELKSLLTARLLRAAPAAAEVLETVEVRELADWRVVRLNFDVEKFKKGE